MNPTLPISRFKDPEPEGQSVAAEPTAEPADALGHVFSMTPEERRAQACKQMARASLPLDASEAWRADLEAYSAEVLKSKHRDVLERRAEAKRRTRPIALPRTPAVLRPFAVRRLTAVPRKEHRRRPNPARARNTGRGLSGQGISSYSPRTPTHPDTVPSPAALGRERGRRARSRACTKWPLPVPWRSEYRAEDGARAQAILRNGRKGGRPRKPVGSGQEPKS